MTILPKKLKISSSKNLRGTHLTLLTLAKFQSLFRSKKIAAKIRAEVEEERKSENSKSGSYWGSSYSADQLNALKNSQNIVPKYVSRSHVLMTSLIRYDDVISDDVMMTCYSRAIAN